MYIQQKEDLAKVQKPDKIQYQIVVSSIPDEEKVNKSKDKQGHYVIGGNAVALTDEEVIDAYKNQHHVERGFRFLKDPLFFASSLFVKSTRRIMGLMMIMLLSLLVYGIAERRMRACLKQQGQTLPNQIGQQISNPTLRWVFQLLQGINYLEIFTGNKVQYVIDGVNELRYKILQLFGNSVANIYQFSSA